MLHITNGDSVIDAFRDAGMPGRYLSWLDALHDGPVPETRTLEELSDVRAHALSGFGWDTYDAIRRRFAERDAVLAACEPDDEVVLWFEHDLFDQLQLLQLLDWFAGRGRGSVHLSVVQIDAFPGVEPFYGLGQLDGEQLAALLPRRREVTAEQLTSGSAAWRAFRAADPTGLIEWTRRDSAGLPFLRAALRRLLEEYPWTTDGLGRNQRQILIAAASGHTSKRDMYEAARESEACPWGDASVYLRIDELADARERALQRRNGDSFDLTDTGRGLLAGTHDWIALNGIERWIGGVHLTGEASPWRWDVAEQAPVTA
ncbi:MAG: hypothetical protein ABR591_11005 [Candidatus Velthaea sp.]